jgi:hypothetical protein
MIDPYIAYEWFDPKTGETTGGGICLLSVIDGLISRGKPLRVVEILWPKPSQN